MGSWKILEHEARMPPGSPRRCATSTSATPTLPPSRTWTATAGSGRTGSGAAPTITSSGPPARTGRPLHPGCRLRTSQAAKHALRWPGAKVVGIDVGATSVRCTEELRRRHGLGNLRVHQLPVERAGDLGTTFDQIVCTGVLHHLPDPVEGLRALRGVLAPGGAMHLMVYAPYGRAGSTCCRSTAAGSASDLQSLRSATSRPASGRCRRATRWSPPARRPDFRDEAGLADALLHPQDRPYSVPQLLDLLGRGGLRFGRWLRQAPYLPSAAASPPLPTGPS